MGNDPIILTFLEVVSNELDADVHLIVSRIRPGCYIVRIMKYIKAKKRTFSFENLFTADQLTNKTDQMKTMLISEFRKNLKARTK